MRPLAVSKGNEVGLKAGRILIKHLPPQTKKLLSKHKDVLFMHHEMQSRNLDKNPDEVRKFTNGKIELANLGDSTIGRMTLEPGWR
jgi:hypothetical protein